MPDTKEEDMLVFDISCFIFDISCFIWFKSSYTQGRFLPYVYEAIPMTNYCLLSWSSCIYIHVCVRYHALDASVILARVIYIGLGIVASWLVFNMAMLCIGCMCTEKGGSGVALEDICHRLHYCTLCSLGGMDIDMRVCAYVYIRGCICVCVYI